MGAGLVGASAAVVVLGGGLTSRGELIVGVRLNGESQVRVELGEHERRLRLKGEGFFEVAPDKSRSSLVEVDGVRVTAVGTRFNVDQRSAPDARILSQSVDRHLDGQLDPVEALAASPALDPPTDLAFFRRSPSSVSLRQRPKRFLACTALGWPFDPREGQPDGFLDDANRLGGPRWGLGGNRLHVGG